MWASNSKRSAPDHGPSPPLPLSLPPRAQENVLASFQVRVTDKEYHAIMARQRVARSSRRHKELQAAADPTAGAEASSDFLLSQGPYMEKNNSIHRDEDKTRWIAPTGFRT